MKRKQADADFINHIHTFWTRDKKDKVYQNIRSEILRSIDKYEKSEEPFVQSYAHRMVGKLDLIGHADRGDIKNSMRRFIRKGILVKLGLQKFFPDLFLNPRPKEDKTDGTNNGCS